jgi:hypothetical protein
MLGTLWLWVKVNWRGRSKFKVACTTTSFQLTADNIIKGEWQTILWEVMFTKWYPSKRDGLTILEQRMNNWETMFHWSKTVHYIQTWVTVTARNILCVRTFLNLQWQTNKVKQLTKVLLFHAQFYCFIPVVLTYNKHDQHLLYVRHRTAFGHGCNYCIVSSTTCFMSYLTNI